MSEFFIVCGEKPKLDDLPNIELVEMNQAEEVVARAARQLFSSSDLAHCWYVRDKQGCADTFFTEAQAAALDGDPLEKTRLYQVFNRALPTAKQVALWYGDEWQDLPVVTDEKSFFEHLKKDLESPTAESWMMFRRR